MSLKKKAKNHYFKNFHSFYLALFPILKRLIQTPNPKQTIAVLKEHFMMKFIMYT